MTKDLIGYEALIDNALRGVVRSALAKVEAQGLRGGHHFFLTFETHHPGVQMPDFLRSQYPDVMTIVVQNKYWGMKAGEDAFEVTLTFKKSPASLRVPYAALTAFFDPSVHFGLQFHEKTRAVAANVQAKDAGKGGKALAATSKTRPLAIPSAKTDASEDQVISLDKFRKK